MERLYFGHYFFPVLIQAREKWTLEQCIQHAVENNLAIKQSDIQVQSNQYNYEAAKASRIPSLNANTFFYESFGRQIDPQPIVSTVSHSATSHITSIHALRFSILTK